MARSGRPRGPLAAALVALVVAVGCAVGGVPDSGPRAPAPETSRSVRTGEPTARADRTTNADSFQDDISVAVEKADLYWRSQFDASGRSFRPISRIVPYRRDGEVACGGQGLPRNNAVYCSQGDFIAYDLNWSVGAYQQVGDAFVYYLLGHEYAHGIQVRLGIRYNFTIQQELQADCMAGAYLGDSIRSQQLRLEQGDLDEFREGLLAVGDDPSQPWFAEGAHGTAEQRTDSFFRGYEKSLSACGLD
ncbi:neutral zinc metallopeptidase [Micromonospora sp. NPDC005174]|uniref:neutral zinc metallopeptidase n=1 Tax=Micromonospora sp. NPDC005174 TaxID=3157018 RepID=UPI0033BE267E